MVGNIKLYLGRFNPVQENYKSDEKEGRKQGRIQLSLCEEVLVYQKMYHLKKMSFNKADKCI